MSSFKWIGLLLATSLSMCSTNQNEKMMQVAHPNGLLLNLPQSLSVEQTSFGFRVRPQGYQELRSSPEIIVTLYANRQQPEGEWPQVRQIDGRTVHYRVEKEAGGSGGDIHVLSAWEAYPNGYIFFRGDFQVEAPAKPDFTLGWIAIKGAKAPGLEKRY
ncbi:MAG TPA: hypothetical protein DDW76_10360 [Cyanobacteria bacterium UBA11369]|nr:hypothetical protein [Cyanobacteria bacterium UBA11368]HBE49174.1 hypothetical protein [Cyanobacteria bacterium UBA11369]